MRHRHPLSAGIAVWLLLAAAAATLSSCGQHTATADRQQKAALDSFVTAYYGWNFPKAARFVTPESLPWLRFAASQVEQEDLDLLNRHLQELEYDVESIDNLDDSTAQAHVVVRHFALMDTLEGPAVMCTEGRFTHVLRRQVGTPRRWLVELHGLPRQEK